MKNICLLILFAIFCKNIYSQSSLEYHVGMSVQRMADGATFRFLKGGDYDEFLEEFSTYYFPGYEKGDTLVYQYIEQDDQLYILSWNTKKQGKNHPVKFAIAWRETSGNPRFGSINLPGNCIFEGFAEEKALFRVADKPGYLSLFFYSTYISNENRVQYDLKKAAYSGPDQPVYESPRKLSKFDATGSKVQNPFGPTARKLKEEQEEQRNDSLLSIPLQVLKNQYKSEKQDANWENVKYYIHEFNNSFFWQDGNFNQRKFSQLYVFVEDKYYNDNKLHGKFISSYPEIIPDKSVSFDSFYHENGIRGWKITVLTLPALVLNFDFSLQEETPFLLIEKEMAGTNSMNDYILPENFYPENSYVKDIASSLYPSDRGNELWSDYALEHKIALNTENLKLALDQLYTRLGEHIDAIACSLWKDSRMLSGTVSPKSNDFLFVMITTGNPLPLKIRKGSGYKWDDITQSEWKVLDLPGQTLSVYYFRSSFPDTISNYSYEYELYPNEEEISSCLLFFSNNKK